MQESFDRENLQKHIFNKNKLYVNVNVTVKRFYYFELIHKIVIDTCSCKENYALLK